MSDKRDPPFDPDATNSRPPREPDPDATLSGPLFGPRGVPDGDPDATVSGPLVRSDPDATIAGPLRGEDPDATISGPLRGADPDATIAGPLVPPDSQSTPVSEPVPPQAEALDIDLNFDMDDTINGPMALVDPEAPVEIQAAPTGKRRRQNPFAPKALPEGLQANLAALGGLNPLIAFANPIFGVVPEIRGAQTHPDPALLKETLQDLIEAFEAGASAAGVADKALEAALFALCCLVDDAATATPWGADWNEKGLLRQMLDESQAEVELFAKLEELCRDPDANADLLEFYYICIALGFEGRFRAAADGREQLDAVRVRLHGLVERYRPRPVDGLSARWRGTIVAPVRQLPAAAPAAGIRWKQGAVATVILLLLFIAYRATTDPAPAPDTVATNVAAGTVAAPGTGTPASSPAALPSSPASPAAPSKAPAVSVPSAPTTPPVVASDTQAAKAPSLQTLLADQISQGTVELRVVDGQTGIRLLEKNQFTEGGAAPPARLRPVIEAIAAALDKVPGAIEVVGHADSRRVNSRQFASNEALSKARAEAVARLMVAKLGQTDRLKITGAGDAMPIAPNDSEANRARNRRVEIRLTRPAADTKGPAS